MNSKKSKVIADPPSVVVPELVVPVPVKVSPYALVKFQSVHNRVPECLVMCPNAKGLLDRNGFDVELDETANPDLVGLCFEKNDAGKIIGVMWFKRSEWE